jgi:hypothetical protein
MKKLISLLSTTLFFSCGESSDSESKTAAAIDFSFILDTIQVDSGEDFVFLNWDLDVSRTSQDGNYLYNFDQIKMAIQFINLEDLVLEKTLSLEIEGPNGIGTDRVYNIYTTESDKLVLTDNYNVAVIDQDGKRSLGFQYVNHDFKGEKLPEALRITYDEFISKDGKTLIISYGDQEMNKSPIGLAFFDLENKVFSYKSFPAFAELDPYVFKYYFDGRPAGFNNANIHLIMKNDSLIFSTSVFNKVYFYNFSTDSTTSKNFQSKHTTQTAPGNYPNRTDTQQELLKVAQTIEKEVNYGPLFFDEQNAVFWRFTKEMDRMKGDTILFKTVLTAFDPDFNQLHEELLPPNFVLSRKYFARKGMIYTFLNIDDELAFVRIKSKLHEN